MLLRSSGGAPRGGEIYPFKESAAALYVCVMFDAPKSDRETRLLSLLHTYIVIARSFVARRPRDIFESEFCSLGGDAAGESDRSLQVVGLENSIWGFSASKWVAFEEL